MADDLELKLKVTADTKDSQDNLKKTAEAATDVGDKTQQAGNATVDATGKFSSFGVSSISAVGGVSRAIIGLIAVMVNFAQSTLGLTFKIENSSLALKSLSFIINNFRKEITLSLGFLKNFANYLTAIDFPIKPIIAFINLMSKFNVVIGIGKGKTIFDDVKEGAKELAEVLKKVTLADLKSDIASAAKSLLVFAANTVIAFKSLQEAVARQAAFSQASRTIDGSSEAVKNLKKEIDLLATTDLAVPVQELYAVAGVAGAMGKSVEDIGGFVRTVSEGVIALNVPAEDLAQRLGTLQTQFGLTEEGLVSLSDQVNTVADTLPGKVAEIDIFEVLSTGVATAGKSFGLLKGETVGLTGALLSLGEAPETARTGIVNLLSGLQNAKNGTKDFQLGLGLLGTSADKLAVDIKDKPLPALMKLLETMHGMSNAGRLDIATKLLGKGQDAIALSKLVDNVDLLKTAINSATDATIYSGSVHKAYLQQMQTVSAATVLLKNSTSSFSESLTVEFLPAIKNVTDGLRWLVNGMAAFSNDHPLIKTIAAVSVGVLSMAGAFRVLRLAMTAVGLMPAGLIAGLGGIGVALVSLNASAIGAIRTLYTLATTGSIFGTLKTAMAFLFGGTIGAAVGAIALLGIGISKLLPMTVQWGETTTTVGEVIAAMWKTIVDSFAPVIEVFGSVGTAIKDFISLLIDSNRYGDALAVMLNNIINVGFLLAGTFNFLVTAIAEGWAAISVEMAAGVQAVNDILAGKGIGKSISDFGDKTTANMKQYADSLEDGFNGIIKTRERFDKKVEANLKKSRSEKPLDKADTRAADAGVAPVSLSNDPTTAKAQIDLLVGIKKEALAREIQAITEAEAEKIRLYTNTGATTKQIADFTFNEKLLSLQQISQINEQQAAQELAKLDAMRVANRAGLAEDTALADYRALLNLAYANKDYDLVVYNQQRITAINEQAKNTLIGFSVEELTAKRTALISIETAYTTQIKNLVALEQEHRNKSVGFIKEIEALKAGQVTNLASLDAIGLTQDENRELQKRTLVADTAKMKSLIANGQFEEAAKLGGETQKIALAIAQTEAQTQKESGWNWTNAKNARDTYNTAVGLTKTALERASNAEIQQANRVQEEANKQRLTLEQVREKIGEIETAVKNGVELKVTADTTDVDAAKARISKPTQSTHTINVVENRSGGTSTTKNPQVTGYKSGGYITGEGTGTSDDIPAIKPNGEVLAVSNGEYIITADKVKQHGVAAFDDINYGNKNPEQINVKRYATGGVVGDDRLTQKVAELKKAEYENVVSVFNTPANQILWSMMEGSHMIGFDAEENQRNFERRAGEYLQKNGLPREYLSMYLKGLSAEKVLSSTKSSIEDKAKAQLTIDDLYSGLQVTPNQDITAQQQANALPTLSRSAPPSIATSTPQMPTISPAGFSPQVTSQSAGKVSTVKFENAAGQTTSGHSNDPNFDKFFSDLQSVSGVTRR